MNEVKENAFVAIYIYRHLARNHYFSKVDTDYDISCHLAQLTQDFYEEGFNDPAVRLDKCAYSFVCAHITSYPSFAYYRSTHRG